MLGGGECIRRPARGTPQDADVEVTLRQFALEVADRGVFSRQARAGSRGPARRRPGPPPAGPCRLQDADMVVAGGQVTLELGDGGVSRTSRSQDHARLLVGGQRLRRPTCLNLQEADVVVSAGQLALELGDRGVFAPAAGKS